MAQDINIQYTDKNFNNLKNQLVEYAKNYFPDTYNDFSPASPGMMFIDMAAYVGDILSFYQDSQLQETFLQYAQDPGNLYAMAYMMGYRPKVSTASSVEIEFTQRVSATGSNYLPNWEQALTIAENAVLAAGDQQFLVDKKVDFNFSSSYDPTEISIYSVSNNQPAEYLLTKKAHATSGKIFSKTVNVGASTKFFTVDIDDENIIGVLDIVDSSDNKWYEVPYLGQETVYVETTNTGTDSNTVPFLLSTVKTGRRFVTRFTSTGKLQIQFGAGMSAQDNETFLPNPTLVGAPYQGTRRSDYAYDPSNFLFSDSYGNAPANTTLTIRYLKGGGIESNVEANSITGLESVSTTATDTSYVSTLSVSNPLAATGGKDGDTLEELRQNSLRAFNEQGRIVTKQDYAFRAMTLPSTLGSIAKAFVTAEDNIKPADYGKESNPLGVSLYVLAYDINKNVTTATDGLKQNLKKYLSQYILITDSVTIKDAFVINIGIKFDIITLPSYNSREVILNCTEELKAYFDISKWSINQPINLSSIYTVLDRVKGVQTVQKIKIESKVGGEYSEYDYDIEGATKSNVVYPSLDPMIFEVKFPNTDIQGRVTTL